MLEGAEHDVLAFMDFPWEHRTKIHSTNTIERLNGEIKRRSNVAGIFLKVWNRWRRLAVMFQYVVFVHSD